ncbi:MAG: carbonic anhydrase [Chloroflexota bacterium]|nr:carbonic anhydrase [Chloroflexota bacterium]
MSDDTGPRGLAPDVALQRLLAGNARYVADRAERPSTGVHRRAEIAFDQHPFAVVLGCSDSRVPAELVFDQGLGDLFMVRVAGNFAGDNKALGSIEYAILYLGVRLVLVLGHERCGAVTAALDVANGGADLPGHLYAVVDDILPAVRESQGQPGAALDNAVRANIRRATAHLQVAAPVLAPRVAAGTVQVVGAYYHLASGQVTLLP